MLVYLYVVYMIPWNEWEKICNQIEHPVSHIPMSSQWFWRRCNQIRYRISTRLLYLSNSLQSLLCYQSTGLLTSYDASVLSNCPEKPENIQKCCTALDFLKSNMTFAYLEKLHVLIASIASDSHTLIDFEYHCSLTDKCFRPLLMVTNKKVLCCLFVCLRILPYSRIIPLYGDNTIIGVGLQMLIFTRNSWPCRSEGSLTCHTSVPLDISL